MVTDEDFEVRQAADIKRHYFFMTLMLIILCLAGGVIAYAVLDSRNVREPVMPTQISSAEGIGEVNELPEIMNDKNDLESLKP